MIGTDNQNQLIGYWGAKSTYEYLLESGIASERLFVLTKGQAAWPYPELLEQNR